MSHNVRSHLCPKMKEKHFQHPQNAKKSHSHFLLAKVEEQKTVEKHTRGST